MAGLAIATGLSVVRRSALAPEALRAPTTPDEVVWQPILEESHTWVRS